MSDLIYRQAAIDAIYEHEFLNWCDKDEVSQILEDLPEAEPEERTAKAENLHDEYEYHYEINSLPKICFITYGDCNICGEQVEYPDKYCHECGAKLDWSDYARSD